MSFIVVNDVAELPWQTNLFDILMMSMFVGIAVYSVVRFVRGTRIYLTIVITAIVYGLVLELAGMATLDMYKQGNFLVMIDWTVIPLWSGTTKMPLYVSIFYPVMLFTGYKVLEALRVRSRWQAAIAGGLFMIALDAPYIIEGNLRYVVWWTWDPNFTLFQYIAGWPMVDLFWQATWDALIFYLFLRVVRYIDPPAGEQVVRWSSFRALVGFPVCATVVVLGLGTLFFVPMVVVTLLGGPQWPISALLLVAYIGVSFAALRARGPSRIEPFTVVLVSAYVFAFIAMIIENIARASGISLAATLQLAGVVVVVSFTALPLVGRDSAARTCDAMGVPSRSGLANRAWSE